MVAVEETNVSGFKLRHLVFCHRAKSQIIHDGLANQIKLSLFRIFFQQFQSQNNNVNVRFSILTTNYKLTFYRPSSATARFVQKRQCNDFPLRTEQFKDVAHA